ncbi:MAG: Rrf2 family transcriptional regulator [Ignavibacteria bacterium]
MKLNTKSRIAVNAMLDVAANGTSNPVALAGIGVRQGISLSYLEQLFRRLRTRGLVKSSRGPGGGYQLGKRASAISIADIVDAVADDAAGKPRRAGSGVRADGLWDQVDRHIGDYLRTVTLEAAMKQFSQVPSQPRNAGSARRREAEALAAA